MTVYRRCMSKDHPADEDRFYAKKDGPCPHCGNEFEENKALIASKLNGDLWRSADQATGSNRAAETERLAQDIKRESFQ